MNQLLTNFGVDWKLLIAQIVNFGILFYVLKRFAYQPILKVLHDRENIIRKGLLDASTAEKTLQQVHIEARTILGDTKKEAHALLQTAHTEAKDMVTASISDGQTKKTEIISSAQHDIDEIQKRSEYTLRTMYADHVIAGIQSILQDEMTSDMNKRLIQKITSH